MSRSRALRVSCLLAAALLPSCSTEYENPFAAVNRTLPLPASARLLFTSGSWSTRVGSPREVFTVDAQGGTVTRITFCNNDTRRCDSTEAAATPDRRRLAVRRVLDSNADDRLTAADGQSLLVVDLARGVDALLVASTARVSALDWSPVSDLLVFSADVAELEDLFRIGGTGQELLNLTTTTAVRERRPRIDPTGQAAVFERIDETLKGQIWTFRSSRDMTRVTTGGEGTTALAGTPYVLGSDADPDYSPDGGGIVFRRLRALGGTANPLGEWDILTVRTDGTNLRTIVTGPAYRGAPDWGADGIAFNEIDATGSRLVTVNVDGGDRRALVTLARGFEISHPRWLP